MSKQVDERVVEMRFDNKQFESATKESMSTLDKLKQKLKLKDATKGLDDLEKAAKKVDLNPLGKSAETITAKFSAMQVAGVTAISNLTNSAINAGKNITKALTIEPVITGFREYETQIGAIQTILANTQKEGTNVERVNAALDELNLYADQTIYNFTEMTRNIGTFTAAGVKLDDSVSAIKGIANLAAISGSTSQQASMAMYQLSQALAAGRVSLMDWNSVVNAGMGGQVFQDALIRTSENLKTGAKEAIATYGTFRESLTKGEWLTTEVLTETLSQLAGAYSEADLLAKGYSEEQAKEIVKLAETAKGAATDVKTFTQLWDTLKEAVQSGWGQTWRMIIGDFDQAKERMTKLSTLFGSIVEKSSNRRNSMLSGALDSNWSKLTTRLGDAGIKTEDFQNKIIELAKTHNVNLDEMIKKEGSFEKALKKAFSSGKLDKSILIDAIKSFTGGITESANAAKAASNQMEKYHEIADRVIHGDFGNGAERIDKLTKAGYEYAAVQNIVNEKLGSSVRHMSSLTDEQIKNADSLANLSDEQLKTKGYTEEQIIALKDLKKEADETGSSIYKLINGFEKPSGVDLAWGSVFNIIDSITESLKAVKKAWTEIFHPGMTEDQIIAERSERLYKLLESIHAFTESLKVNEKTAQKITRTFKGLFAVLDLIRMVVGGALSISFRILKEVLSAFDMDVLDLTANIGDAIVQFHDWITEHNLLAKAIKFVVPYIKEAVSAVSEWIKNNETIQNGIDKLQGVFNNATKGIRNWIAGLKETDNIPKYIISGLVNGIKSGISIVVSVVSELGASIINAIKGVLGIHSPSTEFFEIGKNMIAGLMNGLKEGVSSLLSFIGDIGKKCIEVISNIDFGKIFTLAISAGIIYSGKKIYDLAEKYAAPLEGLGEMFGGIGYMFKKAGKLLNNFANMIKVKKYEAIAKMFLNFGIAIGIMAASIYVLSNIDSTKLWTAVGAVTVLGVVMVALSLAMSNMSGAVASIGKDGLKISGIKTALISMGITLLLLAMTVKMLGKLDPDQAKQGFLGLAGLVAAIGIVLLAFGKFVKGKQAQNIDKFGKTLMKLSISLLLLVAVIKLISGMSIGEIIKGVACIVAFGGIMTGLVALTKLAGKKIDKVGGTLLKMSAAMLLMVMVIKLISGMSIGEITKGVLCIVAFGGIMTGLVALTNLAGGNDISKIGSTLLKMSAAMILMVFTIKLVSGMSVGEIIKGVACIIAFGGIITGLVAATNLAGEGELKRVASTILAMSISIGILAAISVLLGLVDISTLKKGIAAVTILGIIMAGMVRATKGAENVKGNIIAMTVAIGIMAASIAVLSFIDPTKLAGATIAIGMLMGIFAVMVKMAGQAQGGTAIAQLVVMTIAVGLLTGIIYILTQLPIESVLSSASALSVLLLSMSVSLKILSMIGNNIGNAMIGIVSLLALCVPLAAFIGVLALMSNVENAIENAIVLGTFTVVMTGVLAALTLIGAFGPAAIIGVGSLLALAVPLVAFVGVLALMQGIQNAEKNAIVLGTFTVVMTGVLAALTLIGALGPAAIIGVGSLVALVVALTGLTVALGALNEKFPQLETFLDSGISLLTRLAGGMGQVIGSFVSGLAEGLTSGLPDIATNLSLFMTNLTPFIVGAKMLDESTLSNVKTLISIMAALTGASLLESITSWFGGGGSSLVDFANQLVPFGVAMMVFSSTVTGINGEAITAAANAGKMMAEMAESIPKEGGLWQKIAGEQDIADFGKKVIAFGSAIKEFSMSMSDFTINEEAITSAANAGKQMSELANKIPKSGGLWQKIAGEQDIADFGKKVTTFGKSIKKFASSIKGLTIDESAMESAINASIKMNEFSEEIPKSGGLWQKIAGEQDIADFGKKVAAFGTSIKKFITSVSGENDNIDSAVSSLIGLLRLLKNISDVNSDSVDAFKESLESLGKTSVNDFIKSFDGADTRAKNVIIKFLNSLSKTINDNKESSKSAFRKIGKYLVDGFCQGITENTFKAEAKARVMAKAAYDAAKNELDVNSPSKKFMKIGKSVVEGFGKGITKNVGDANKASVKMANGVLESTQKTLGINSPSIVFKEEVGRYIVQGIAEGIKSDMSAEEAAEQKANNIINAFKKVIDSNNLDSDIAKNAFDVWSIGEGKYASDDVKDAKKIEYLTGQIPRDSKNVQLVKDKWLEMKANFGATDDRTKEAYKEYQSAIITQQETLDAIADISKNAADRQNSVWDQEMANLDADYDLWESMYGDYVSEKTKNAQRRSTLIKKVAIQDKKTEEAFRKLSETEKTYGKESSEWLEQYEIAKNEKKAASDLRNEIKNIDKETRESVKESREIEQSIADIEYDTWLKTTGRNATEAEKDAKHLENLNSTLVRQNANLRDAEKEYEELCLRLGKDSAEAQKQLETVTQYRNDIATTNSEIYQITEDAIQREKDLLRERQEIASDTADLQYQIWEKIFGRDATDAEKDTVKLGTLNKQVIAQSNILAMTQKNLDEAIKTYGSDSVEAQRAYNEYLQEEYNLAQLHSDILDVEESIADREKRMQERRRNAKNDYLDYIKKYEKYYLEHGMTREELEKDAKLVSGYDPDKLINKTVSDVSKGVNKVINGHEYKNIITNFSNIGTDYATSISEGVSNGTPKVISSATTMVSDCVTTLNETQPSWISTGSYLLDGLTKGVKDASKKLNKTILQVSDNAVFLLKLKYYDWCDAASYLVNGFIEGIRSRIWAAAQAAAEMAYAALAAAEEALDINSPSKEFARVGAYAVMGMIEGLKDNTYLVADAATDVGDVAIDNLKNSIKRISDIVNSEIDTQPTIRPILDLSDVASKASRLDAIVSRTQAMRINNEIARSNTQNIQNGADSNASFGNTYQFTQNNYSPKELSSIEIYRRTKNQFAMMKMAKGMG